MVASEAPQVLSFSDLGLDPRLLKALSKKGYLAPTPVQAHAIPKALEGKDVVARARTGSGKTMAYLLPALQRLIGSGDVTSSFQAIVMVPTRELCEQVRDEANALVVHSGTNLRVTSLGGELTDGARRVAISNAGNVVVTTPGRLAISLKDGSLPAAHLTANLKVLVLDEADLLLSYGYEADLQLLAPKVPRSCQCVLMSATTSTDVESLSKLVLHNPVALDLTHLASLSADGAAAAEVEHFMLEVDAADRLLVVMTMLRLNLLRRKVLMFVNSVDTAYKLRLLLEAFGQRSAVLNAELPLNSRHHIIQQFNTGLFDLLIATDGSHAQHADKQAPRSTSGTGASTSGSKASAGDKQGGGRKRARKGDDDKQEFGVTRGIDFKGVRTVINVELPGSVQGYTHRVGRTGRAGHSGLALTLFTKADASFRDQVQQSLQAKVESAPGVPKLADAATPAMRTFDRLKKEALESLRYRAEDTQRQLTKTVVREARQKDLKLEILNSTRLQEFFEAHEADQHALKHDKALAKDPQRHRHLRSMPDYIKVAAGVKGRGPARASTLKRKLQVTDDPLRGKASFKQDQSLTDVEKASVKNVLKKQRKMAKNAPPVLVAKQNVRKRRG